MCDNPDEFSDCGEGVILYFSFFKFCIIVAFIATIGITLFDSYISYNYYSELRKICDNEHYKKYFNNTNHLNYPFNNQYFRLYYSIKDKCQVYSSEYLMDHKLLNSFFFKVSLINYRNYRIIAEYFFENYKFESTIINLNCVNFFMSNKYFYCLFSLYFFYI